MDKKIKVSVNIPAYNEEGCIGKAIESVLAQDYDDFELIIVDDGSQDNTAKIIKKYRDHPKVRCYFRKKHKGIGPTRNELLRLSQGKYISPYDADDIMLPGKLKRQAEFLDRNPPIGVVYGKALCMNKDNHIVKEKEFGSDYKKTWDLIDYVIPPGSAMIRRGKMLKIGGFNEYTDVNDDTDLFLKLAELTNIFFMDSFFSVYRIHKGNTWRFNKRRFKELKTVRNEAIKRRYKNRKPFFVNTNGRISVLNKRFISNAIDSQVIILDTETHNYYKLNETASIIWLFLERGKEITRIIDLIAKRFNVVDGKARNDVCSFLNMLKKSKILV